LERLRLASNGRCRQIARAPKPGGRWSLRARFSPWRKTRRLVLLTDGNDTSGQLAAAAQRLSASGVELFTVPLRKRLRS
jgi:hypothetical protein